MEIRCLQEEEALPLLPQLITLLQDGVGSGASIGFMPPLTLETAEAYWREVLKEVSQNKHILLVAEENGEVRGSVQLALATKENGLHRAEVQKLIVRTTFRNQGIARRLMQAIEDEAHRAKRTLLVLDTLQGDVAESLYRKIGYVEAGVIPHFARGDDGNLYPTVLFYRLLSAKN